MDTIGDNSEYEQDATRLLYNYILVNILKKTYINHDIFTCPSTFI